MKLQPDKSSAPMVRAYSLEWLQIDDQRFTGSVTVSSVEGHRPAPWSPDRFEALQASHLEALLDIGAELVILGTGRQLRRVPVAWQAPFVSRRIGLEVMDTAAACRTYNILASEGRKVLAALLHETA